MSKRHLRPIGSTNTPHDVEKGARSSNLLQLLQILKVEGSGLGCYARLLKLFRLETRLSWTRSRQRSRV